MISQVKSQIGDWLQMRAIRRHGSRVGWQIAGRYTDYWKKARAACPRPMPEDVMLRRAIDEYTRDRATAFGSSESEKIAREIARRLDAREASGEAVWCDPVPDNSNVNYAGDLWHDFPEIKTYLTNILGPFLEGYFGCPYKIFYATMYKSFHVPVGPKYSALWHSDSGPGTCINCMFYLDDTEPADGALQILGWRDSVEIFKEERPQMRQRRKQLGEAAFDSIGKRNILCAWYDEVISSNYSDRVLQPTGTAGLTIAFGNNTIHRGGFSEPGRRRRAVIFHCYPSNRPTDFAIYDKHGIAKRESYPKDPAMEF